MPSLRNRPRHDARPAETGTAIDDGVQLLALAGSDEQAARAAFEQWWPRLVAYFTQRGHGDASEDLASETLMRLVRDVHTVDHDIERTADADVDGASGGVIAWVWTVARHRSIEAMRRTERAEQRVQREWNRNERAVTPLDGGAGEAAGVDVGQAMRELSDSTRAVVFTRYVLGVPSADIAADLGMTDDAVRAAAARGVQVLDERLRKQRRETLRLLRRGSLALLPLLPHGAADRWLMELRLTLDAAKAAGGAVGAAGVAGAAGAAGATGAAGAAGASGVGAGVGVMGSGFVAASGVAATVAALGVAITVAGSPMPSSPATSSADDRRQSRIRTLGTTGHGSTERSATAGRRHSRAVLRSGAATTALPPSPMLEIIRHPGSARGDARVSTHSGAQPPNSTATANEPLTEPTSAPTPIAPSRPAASPATGQRPASGPPSKPSPQRPAPARPAPAIAPVHTPVIPSSTPAVVDGSLTDERPPIDDAVHARRKENGPERHRQPDRRHPRVADIAVEPDTRFLAHSRAGLITAVDAEHARRHQQR